MAKPNETQSEMTSPTSPETVTVFIHSKGIETLPKKQEDGRTRHFVTGAINLEPFEVECDKHVELPVHIAEVLKPLMERFN